MTKKSTKKTVKKDKESPEELEKLKILSDTDKVKGEQLSIGLTGKLESKKELKQFALGNIENPNKKYDVYYKGISKLLLKHLPKGKEYKKARNYIYEEKNVFLTRGYRINKQGIRGADGRMGYITDAESMLNLIMDWIIGNGSMVELFNNLRDLNKKKGYGTRQL